MGSAVPYRIRRPILGLRALQFGHIHTAGLRLQVLERGERIELLVQSTDNLQTQAFSFKRDAGRLQRSMWWKNTRAQVTMSQPSSAGSNHTDIITDGCARRSRHAVGLPLRCFLVKGSYMCRLCGCQYSRCSTQWQHSWLVIVLWDGRLKRVVRACRWA